VQGFKDPNGQTQLALTGACQMAEHAAQILEALTAIPSNTIFSKEAWNAFVGGKIVDPSYATLFKTWRLYTMEYARVDDLAVWSAWPISGTPPAVRSFLRTSTRIADTVIKHDNLLWHQMGPDGDAPGYSPEAEAIFDAISERMNTETGQISIDVPLRLRACCSDSGGDHT
jgi:hypothetical protein